MKNDKEEYEEESLSLGVSTYEFKQTFGREPKEGELKYFARKVSDAISHIVDRQMVYENVKEHMEEFYENEEDKD